MGDSPIAVATFEAIEIPATELFEKLAVRAFDAMPRQNLSFDLGDRGRFEIDRGLSTKMGGGNGVLAQFAGRVNCEVGTKSHETAVVVGAIGMINGRHQIGIATVDAVAIIEQASLDGRDRREGFEGSELSEYLFRGCHNLQG